MDDLLFGRVASISPTINDSSQMSGIVIEKSEDILDGTRNSSDPIDRRFKSTRFGTTDKGH